jgi:hypothetical protein
MLFRIVIDGYTRIGKKATTVFGDRARRVRSVTTTGLVTYRQHAEQRSRGTRRELLDLDVTVDCDHHRLSPSLPSPWNVSSSVSAALTVLHQKFRFLHLSFNHHRDAEIERSTLDASSREEAG